VHDTLNTHSVITCRIASSDRFIPIEFDCRADVEAARRWKRVFRRIDRVEFERQGETTWRCSVRAVGHRVPVRRSVPLRIALGLAALGTPTLAFDREAGR